MEREIYLDILIFLNTVINYFLLLVTARLSGRQTKAKRVLAAAFLGGIYALVLLLPSFSGALLVLSRIGTAALMVRVAFRFYNLWQFALETALFYLVSFVFAGLMVAVWFVFAPSAMAFHNGAVYFHIPVLVLVLCVFVCYLLVSLCQMGRKKSGGLDKTVRVQIGLGEKSCTLTGMVDTGNRLYDPFGGLPVVIGTYRSLKGILPDSLQRYFEKPSSEALAEALDDKVRLVPFQSLGESGLVPAFLPDIFLIRQNETAQTAESVLVAVKDVPAFHGVYQLLLHPDLQYIEHIQKKGKGDRYGKGKSKAAAKKMAGQTFGHKRRGFLHKRPGEFARAAQPGGGGEGLSSSGRRRKGQRNFDRT